MATMHSICRRGGKRETTTSLPEQEDPAIESSPSMFDTHLIFLQASSFGAGRVRTADGGLEAFFDQKLHILLQALEEKDKNDS